MLTPLFMTDPITLPSGASLALTIAPLDLAKKLNKVVARELSLVKFDFDLNDFNDLGAQNIDALKNVAFQLVQSESLELVVMECMKKCLYNGERIVAGTFEPEDARQDYFPVAWEVLKVNLRPFLKSLSLLLLTRSGQTSSGPTSE